MIYFVPLPFPSTAITPFFSIAFSNCVVFDLPNGTMLKPISEIAPYVPFGKSKTTQLLKAMEKKGVIAVEGKGRGTKYIIK